MQVLTGLERCEELVGVGEGLESNLLKNRFRYYINLLV